MSSELFERAGEVFKAALDQPTGERTAYIEQCCAGDTALLREVRSLLAHHEQAGGSLSDSLLHVSVSRFLALSANGDVPVEGVELEVLPVRIGRYRVLRKIGDGGMGTVYEAQQDNPSRTVALKVLRAAAVNPEVLRRFAHEAQILGRLHHSGIAQIFEAGTADVYMPAEDAGQTAGDRGKQGAEQQDGIGATIRTLVRQPYFAMELVRGRTLTAHAAASKLGTRDRLRLFASVCDAVDYAHRQGVIHRDLKPGNILVDEHGQPKVLDFGVARVTASDVQVTTLRTGVGQLIGTLSYMSPEQVSGDPTQIDHISDVYSLGVILFELLTDRLPYDIRHKSIPEALRTIREHEPSRLSSINLTLRGDLDTIAAKALDKEKSRRYQSAAALAEDIRRHLADQPISARPPSAMYQLRKFAKRNRALVGGVLGTVAALVVGLIGMTLLAIRENEQRLRAENLSVEAQRVAYRASVLAAAAALENHDVALASRSLSEAPAKLRGWEWGLFESRLDASLMTIPLQYRGYWKAHFCDGGNVVEMWSVLSQVWMRWESDTGVALPNLSCENAAQAGCFGGGATRLAWTQDDKLEIRPRDGQVVRADPSDWGLPIDHQLIGIVATPDGSRLAGYDNTNFSIWFVRVSDGQAWSRTTETMGIGSLKLAMGAGDRVVVTAAVKGRPAIWHPPTDSVVVLQEQPASVRAVAFSPDGRYVATGSLDTTVKLWDAETGSLLATGRGHSDVVGDTEFSPDGAVLASCGTDRTVRLWRASDLSPIGVLPGHASRVTTVAFSPDGSRLVTLADDDSLRIWSADAARQPWVLHGHTSYVYPVGFSPDGSYIASGGWDNVVRLWDRESLEQFAVLRGQAMPIINIAFSPDGRRLASISSKQVLVVHDLATGATLPRSFQVADAGAMLAFASDSTHMFVRTDTQMRELDVWNCETSAVHTEPWAVFPLRYAGDGHPRGGILSPTGEPGCISHYDAVSGTRRVGDVMNSPVSVGPGAAPGAAQRVAAVQAWRGRDIGIWNAETGERLATLRGHSDAVFAIEFSPDGLRIATAGDDQTIRIWDGRTYEEIVQLRGHTSYIWALAWSQDGGTLLSGSGDHTIRVWEARSAAAIIQARRTRQAMLVELRPVIDSLLAQGGPRAEIVAKIAALPGLDERRRTLVWQALMTEWTKEE